MPELPEVETVARLLRPKLEGRTLLRSRVLWKRSTGGLSARQFDRHIGGACVRGVARRAKYLLFELERERRPAGFLVGHLRMTGRMQIDAPGIDPGPYLRVAIELDDGQCFHFIDVRKFGRLQFAHEPGAIMAALGPEPLGPEFTAPAFAAALRARARRLKPLLLDQSFVAGLGNIYVDESLFRAGLHPLAIARRVKTASAHLLQAAIRAVLAEAIEREGSSFDSFYRTPEGQPGSYQDQFRVYGREGKPCRVCRTPIKRIVVGQRGTHFCPRCQSR